MRKITQSEFDMKAALHNRWREGHRDGKRLVLNDSDLMECDLRGCGLVKCDLRGCDFRGSNLSDSDMRYCDLSNCNLSGSNLSGSDFSGSNLSGSNLSGSDFSRSDFSDSNLSGCDMRHCDFSGSDFSGSDLSGCDMRGCDLSGSDLSDAINPAPAEPIAKTKGSQTRQGILDTARSHVSHDRESTSESPEDSFGIIAEYWEAHLGHPVKATDVAIMMALLKVARLRTTPTSLDSWVDLAGYAACGGEIAMEDKSDA